MLFDGRAKMRNIFCLFISKGTKMISTNEIMVPIQVLVI